MTTILDPTDERVPIARSVTERPPGITGNVALLDIAKPRGNVLLDRLQQRLAERLPGATINRYAQADVHQAGTHGAAPGHPGQQRLRDRGACRLRLLYHVQFA